MPADEYVAMASDPSVLGDPLLKTQHFIGASKWMKVSDDEAVGFHQMRVPHQRYADDDFKEVVVKGHAHGSNQHWYRRCEDVDGTWKWKFAGLAVEIRWGEFDFDRVFVSGEEKYGEGEGEKARAVAGAQIIAGVPSSDLEPTLLSASSLDGGPSPSPKSFVNGTNATHATPEPVSAKESVGAAAVGNGIAAS